MVPESVTFVNNTSGYLLDLSMLCPGPGKLFEYAVDAALPGRGP